ncbi:Auxin-induced protein 15A [Heracleum sosnowskyi]|uniref:Auxin-induced protein 15A n=1 Tax=Heracleum sosnowskyi TaxID=360622 RepID=A0AAD8JI53_9APIA|nr:Auxin-induced protein 15A [Heracleum sosnowskyi]
MLGKKFYAVKKLAKKVQSMKKVGYEPSQRHSLLEESVDQQDETSTPTGFLAVYVGEERKRFVVPTGYLSHPLFKMLLEKAYNEFGFKQTNGLVVPCSVAAFQGVINAVECCNGNFDFGNLVEEFLS